MPGHRVQANRHATSDPWPSRAWHLARQAWDDTPADQQLQDELARLSPEALRAVQQEIRAALRIEADGRSYLLESAACSAFALVARGLPLDPSDGDALLRATILEDLRYPQMGPPVPSLNGACWLAWEGPPAPAAVRALHRAGCDVHVARRGLAPLGSAVLAGRFENAAVLVQCGADIDEQPTSANGTKKSLLGWLDFWREVMDGSYRAQIDGVAASICARRAQMATERVLASAVSDDAPAP